MNFPEYINKIQPFIHGESRTQTTESVLSNFISTKIEYTNSSFQKFSDPKTPYYVSAFMRKHKSLVDQEKYIKYLKTLRHPEEAKKRLCEAFEGEIDNLNTENIYDRLAVLLKDILLESLDHKNEENHQSANDNGNKDSNDFSENEKDVANKEILQSLTEIEAVMQKLHDRAAELNNHQNNAVMQSMIFPIPVIKNNNLIKNDGYFRRLYGDFEKLSDKVLGIKDADDIKEIQNILKDISDTDFTYASAEETVVIDRNNERLYNLINIVSETIKNMNDN